MTAPRLFVAALLLLTASCAGVRPATDTRERNVRLALAREMAGRGDWTGAFHAADALAQDGPSDAEARLLRGAALRHRGMPAEAERDLRRVLALQSGSAAAHAELGLLCERQDRRAEALEHHREAHRLAPEEPAFRNNLAFAYLIRGRGREAIPILEEALQADPENRRLRNNLGFALASVGEFARADRQFRLGGTAAQARNNLGFAYERSGNLAQAHALYLEALALDPAEATARGNLVHVARAMGREPPASPDGPGVPRVEKGAE